VATVALITALGVGMARHDAEVLPRPFPVTVLPFQDAAPEASPSNAGMCLADALAGRLSELRAVVLRSSDGKAAGESPLDFGRRIGAQLLVDGTVRREERRL